MAPLQILHTPTLPLLPPLTSMLLMTAHGEDVTFGGPAYLEMIEDMERELNKVIEAVSIVILTHTLARPGERRRLLYLVRELRIFMGNREYVARR